MLLASFQAVSATDIEREKLQQIANEMDVLTQLVHEAKSYSSETDPQIFEYQKLLWNLTEIRGAIQRHVNQQTTAPRSVKELMVLKGQ